MTALSVALDATLAPDAIERTVLATVPARWRAVAAGEAADVIVVVGSEDGWPGRVEKALARRPRGVVVTRPAWADPEQLRALQRRAVATGTVVTVESSFLTDPTWLASAADIARDAANASIISTVA